MTVRIIKSIKTPLQILNDNLNFIEKQCKRIIKNHSNDYNKDILKLKNENRVLELFNIVIDVLKRDDYKIIRNFNNKSKITTYFTSVIARQFVEIVRKDRGRDRQKERAVKFGDLGLNIYKLIFIEKNSIEDCMRIINFKTKKKIEIREVEEIVDFIRRNKNYDGSDPNNYSQSAIKNGYLDGDNIELTDYKNKNNPEVNLLNSEKEDLIRRGFVLINNNLTEKEKFILKIKYYNEKIKPKDSTKIIMNFLNIDRRRAYSEINKILKKCKNILLNEGINYDELF